MNCYLKPSVALRRNKRSREEEEVEEEERLPSAPLYVTACDGLPASRNYIARDARENHAHLPHVIVVALSADSPLEVRLLISLYCALVKIYHMTCCSLAHALPWDSIMCVY